MGEFHYEFFGPVGTFCTTFGLPVVIYGLNFLSNKEGCLQLYPLTFPSVDKTQRFLSWEGIAVAYAWFFGHLLLHGLLPAKEKAGVIEPDGTRWLYRLNGSVPRAPVLPVPQKLPKLSQNMPAPTKWYPRHCNDNAVSYFKRQYVRQEQ